MSKRANPYTSAEKRNRLVRAKRQRTKRLLAIAANPSPRRSLNTTGSTNSLTLSGMNRIMPETFNTIIEITDTTNTVLGTGGGLVAGNIYYANGIYDYTSSLGNRSVPGFDVFAAIYRKYRVKGVKLTFRAVNNSTSPIIMQASMFNTGSTLFTSWAELRQLASNKWCKERLLSAKGGADKGEISMYVDLATFIGNKNEYKAEENFIGSTGASGTTAANPANLLELRCYALSADGTTNVAASAMVQSINIVYYVEYFGLQNQPGQ